MWNSVSVIPPLFQVVCISYCMMAAFCWLSTQLGCQEGVQQMPCDEENLALRPLYPRAQTNASRVRSCKYEIWAGCVRVRVNNHLLRRAWCRFARMTYRLHCRTVKSHFARLVSSVLRRFLTAALYFKKDTAAAHSFCKSYSTIHLI